MTGLYAHRGQMSEAWSLVAGRALPFLLLLSLLISGAAAAQVIHDLAEIDSDVLIIGESGGDKICKIAVFDFNGNGQDDLFIGGHRVPRGEVYGFLDKSLHHNQTIDLAAEEPDLLFIGDLPRARASWFSAKRCMLPGPMSPWGTSTNRLITCHDR